MAQLDDQALAYEMERQIGLHPTVNLHDLKFNVAGGRIQLEGVVPTLSDKREVLAIATRLVGVERVDEAIAVETPHVPDDDVLSNELDAALAEEEVIDDTQVGAVSVRGQAILLGCTSTLSELSTATEVAAEVPGTVNVVDSSQFANPHGPDQIDLVNAVADALRNHPVLRTRMIRPVLQETGKVILTGTVRSDEERYQALEVATHVPGVHTVLEDLQIVP